MTLRSKDPFAKLKYRLRQEGKIIPDKKRTFPIEDQLFHWEIYLNTVPISLDTNPQLTKELRTNDLKRRINAKRHTEDYVNNRIESKERLEILNEKYRRMLFK